ncbi:hypothetical protein SAMN05421747_10419 [Parapedobacter composti]|uniref:Uncharacterized protein n=1 Tax=Parapedobacter composti TaxID=623281 RepID=A0A1I1G7I2_9SPHI|nr:hypothetical protein [Parapedobacter composti]SFC07524.1 hypothetical protein SAMN05421747_10419 [Parapedobacter composti]
METTIKLEVKQEVAPIVEQIAEFVNSVIDPKQLADNLDEVLCLYAQAIAKYPEGQEIYVSNDHVDNVWALKELIRLLRGGQVWLSDALVQRNADFADALRIMQKYLIEGNNKSYPSTNSK